MRHFEPGEVAELTRKNLALDRTDRDLYRHLMNWKYSSSRAATPLEDDRTLAYLDGYSGVSNGRDFLRIQIALGLDIQLPRAYEMECPGEFLLRLERFIVSEQGADIWLAGISAGLDLTVPAAVAKLIMKRIAERARAEVERQGESARNLQHQPRFGVTP